MAQQKRKQFVTPAGVAIYPWLNQPDTKFVPEGEFKVNLRLSAEEAEQLINQLGQELDNFAAEAIKKDPKVKQFSKRLPFEEEIDDNGDLTGSYIFKFKQKAKINTKSGDSFNMKVALFDAKRTPTTVNVGGGSTLKVAFTAWPYTMASSRSIGLTLRPSAVQILQLVELSGGDDANMFDDEDGFEVDTGASAFVDEVRATMNTSTDEDELDF